MNLSLDDMLFELRAQVGIPNPAHAHSLKNEEGTWFGLGGNVLGQWLQAYPRFYAVTGRVEAKEKADAFVDGHCMKFTAAIAYSATDFSCISLKSTSEV